MIDFGLVDINDCNLNINPNWTFCEAVSHIKALKYSYEYLLRFFSCFDFYEKNNFIGRTKKAFYSLNLIEWQIDSLWRYMNNDEHLNTLKTIANRQNVK